MMALQRGTAVPRPLALSPSTLRSLPVRPRPDGEESIEGHWLRVAHANGLADPTWLLDAGHRRAQSMVRLCPRCLDDPSPRWSPGWKDRFKPTCAEHGIWLVDRCFRCKQLLRWSNVRFLSCRCGQDLRTLEGEAVSEPMRRVLMEGTVPVPVLLWLGSLAVYGLGMKPLKKASRQSLSEVTKLAEAGAEIVANWPQSFFGVLDQCRSDISGQGGLQALNEALPGLTKRISKLRDMTWRARIAEELGAYANASLQSRLPITGRNVPGPRPPTVAQIARQLGMRSSKLAADLDRLPDAQVVLRTTSGGRCRRLVSPEAVQQVQQKRLDEISVKEAARLIGLRPVRVQLLIAAGLLESRANRLSREAVLGFLALLLDSGSPNRPDADSVALSWALRHCVPVCSTVQFFQAIKGGSLSIHVPRGAARVTDLQVSKSCCRDWAAPIKQPDGRLLTIPECAETLRLKQQVVYHLVQVGLLPAQAVKTGPRRSARMTSGDEVARFKRRYESLARLAADAGVDHRSAFNWARDVGLTLVTGPSIDGGRQYFALRPPPF
jgi:predicted DNA-binding transcriptional regulator AlpA